VHDGEILFPKQNKHDSAAVLQPGRGRAGRESPWPSADRPGLPPSPDNETSGAGGARCRGMEGAGLQELLLS